MTYCEVSEFCAVQLMHERISSSILAIRQRWGFWKKTLRSVSPRVPRGGPITVRGNERAGKYMRKSLLRPFAWEMPGSGITIIVLFEAEWGGTDPFGSRAEGCEMSHIPLRYIDWHVPKSAATIPGDDDLWTGVLGVWYIKMLFCMDSALAPHMPHLQVICEASG